LPPTNFFNSAGDDEDSLAPEEFKDLESILDELMTHGLRHKRLQWHYRSRHEGLIAFSNRQYYENELLTFPSAETALGGVRFKHLPEARYDKGKSRTNRKEAEALVTELVARLRNSESPRYSYGIVTFSLAQQQLIDNLLDEERRKYPEIEVHFGDEPPVEGEPVFVKNLENVQGDERDVIFFSICYGADETGRVAMNFGPLNRDGGERRLNVAITRAKHEVLVFSGLRADEIDLTRTRARGCVISNTFSITPNVVPARWQRQLQYQRTVIPILNLSKWLLTGCGLRDMRFITKWAAPATGLIWGFLIPQIRDDTSLV
jgi:superfamily I DNA and/or RNA helicase